MFALLVGNVATTFSEFAGIASGMEMFGVSKYVSVPIAAVTVWLLIVGGSYKRVQNVFLALSFVFVTYIIAAVLAQPDWNDALTSTVVPQVTGGVSWISLVIAMIGTTIAPWMMFFTQSNVVEKGTTTNEALRAEDRRRIGNHRRLPRRMVHHRDHGSCALPARHRGRQR